MIEIQSHRESEFTLSELSLKTKLIVCIAISIFFILGQVLAPLEFLTAIAIGAPLTYIVTKNEFGALLVLLIVYTLLAIKPRSVNGEATPLELIAGILIVIVSIPLLIKLIFFTREQVAFDLPQRFLILYFIWVMVIGIIGVVFWRNTFNNWIREILLQLSFLVVPVIMVRSTGLKTNREKKLTVAIFLLWILIIVMNVVRLKSNISQAYFFFQTGRASFSVSLSSLMLFSFVSLSFTEYRRKSPVFLYGVILVAISAVAVSLYRTAWITDILMIGALFLIAFPKERRNGLKSFAIIILLLISTMVVLCFISPLFYLFIQSYATRLTTASQVTVDPSLVNRYVEWRVLLKFIMNSPITGYGYGAEFFDYNWLSGTSYWTGYTHNGYLGLLLKGGIIGFIFLSIAYGMLIYKGVKLARNIVLDAYYRALARAGVVYLIGILFITMTLNALADRDQIFWAAVVWGYFLLCEKHLKKIKAKSA